MDLVEQRFVVGGRSHNPGSIRPQTDVVVGTSEPVRISNVPEEVLRPTFVDMSVYQVTMMSDSGCVQHE